MNTYKGKLHFNYEYYYKIFRHSKTEVSDLLSQYKENINNCDNENNKNILIKEYELLLERYNELV